MNPNFWDFSIHLCENARVGANFVVTYLSNREELRRRGFHFGKYITSATTLDKDQENQKFDPGPPPCRLKPCSIIEIHLD